VNSCSLTSEIIEAKKVRGKFVLVYFQQLLNSKSINEEVNCLSVLSKIIELKKYQWVRLPLVVPKTFNPRVNVGKLS